MTTEAEKDLNLDDIEETVKEINRQIIQKETEINDLKASLAKIEGERTKKDEKLKAEKDKAERIRILLRTSKTNMGKLDTALKETKEKAEALMEVLPKTSSE